MSWMSKSKVLLWKINLVNVVVVLGKQEKMNETNVTNAIEIDGSFVLSQSWQLTMQNRR